MRVTRRPFRWAGSTTWSARPPWPTPASATLSVHAYSPPLTAMSYYEVTERATLRRTRTELTDGPEGHDEPHRGDPVRRAGAAEPAGGRRGARRPCSRGAILVDIRPAAQRAAEGEVPAAVVIERNVLEWRCDPTSDARLPEAVDDDVEWVVLCSQGYTSSLAAAALLDLGLHRATDVVGGYQALAEAGVLAELS